MSLKSTMSCSPIRKCKPRRRKPGPLVDQVPAHAIDHNILDRQDREIAPQAVDGRPKIPGSVATDVEVQARIPSFPGPLTGYGELAGHQVREQLVVDVLGSGAVSRDLV